MGTRTVMEPKTIHFCDECGEKDGTQKSLRQCVKCGRDLCEDHRLDVSSRITIQQYLGFSICYSCIPTELLPNEVITRKGTK